MLVIAANLFGFFFVNDYRTFFVAAVMIALVYVVQTASKLPMFVALLPQASYGQFSSANAMVVSVFLIFANFGGGIFIDLLGYRYIFIWDLMFTALGLFALIRVYQYWTRLGGRKGYVPPVVA